MPLPLVLAGAKAALGAAKAAKAAKALKAAKSMKAAGSAAKGAKAAKGAGAPKKLMTEGFNNVGSKDNLRASKERLKTAKKQERLQKGADRLVKRDQRRTEMKKNMEARAKQQEQESSGESKKKESIKELYDKSREGLERKDRRSAAMSNFVTKGTMKHGGKYEHGGRKPLKKLKGAIQKANHKAGAVKNRLEKKVLEAVKRKKDMKKMPGGGKMDMKKMPGGGKMKLYKKGGKKFPDLNKDGKITMADILQGRGVIKKAMKGMKHEEGGKYDPKKAAMMKGLEAKIKKAKGTPAAKPLVDKYRKLTKAEKGMKYENGGKLNKKGPATNKIKNNKANLEAKKLNASGLIGDKYERRHSAGVGKNMYSNKKLQPLGYKPKPKSAPKSLRKIKGYEESYDHRPGKNVNSLIRSSTNSEANRARVFKNKQDAKKNRRR